MEKGNIRFNGKTVECQVEIVNKEIVLHLPEGTDSTNWYHSVCIKKDLNGLTQDKLKFKIKLLECVDSIECKGLNPSVWVIFSDELLISHNYNTVKSLIEGVSGIDTVKGYSVIPEDVSSITEAVSLINESGVSSVINKKINIIVLVTKDCSKDCKCI